jgi:polyhydroxyalkanoate synthesis regulator phasin
VELITRDEATQLSTDITSWSEEKRAEFCTLFDRRSATGQVLIWMTTEYVLTSTYRRKILSAKHLMRFLHRWGGELYSRDAGDVTVGLLPHSRKLQFKDKLDRPEDDLRRIAKERGMAILDSMPPLQKALEILDPGTLKLMKRKDAITPEGEKLIEELENVSESIRMSDHPDMKVQEFMEHVRARNKRRLDIIQKLGKLGAEGTALEQKIGKALFAGVPGLSEAVLDIAEKLIQQAVAMGEMNRRIEERVKFGDSQQAMELLHRFEEDEMSVDNDIAERLRSALDKLKVAKPAKKKLAGKKGS